MNKLFIYIFIVICIVVIFITLGGGLSRQKKSLDYNQKVIRNLDELSYYINIEIADGKDGILTFNIADSVSDNAIKKVNYSIDTMKGSIKTITTYASSGNKDYRKVEFDFEKSDSLYVYEKIVKGSEIPTERTKAVELLNVCEKILKDNVKTGMTEYEKELVIHDYIVNNCKYGTSEKNDDTEFTAYGALVNGRAVCSGYAAAMQLLLSCSGVESKIMTGQAESMTKKSDVENHAWNQVRIDGIWYNLDTTWDDPVSQSGDILSHEFFNINDDILSKTHEWNETTAEKCDNLKENYYMHNGAYFSDYDSLKNYLTVKLTGGNVSSVECIVNNLEINDSTLQFLFEINGVSKVSYSTSDLKEYNLLVVYINK